MNKQPTQASVATTVSRRGFVEGAAGLMFAFTLGGLGRVGDALGATQAARINAWVAIGTDDSLSVGGNGSGRNDVLAAHSGRGTRRRLVEGEDRVCARESEGLRKSARVVQRRADHRRKRLRSRLFHAAACGRRPGTPRAARERGR